MRFYLFQILATLLLAGVQFYLYRGIMSWTRERGLSAGARRVLVSSFVVFNLPLLLGPLFRYISLSMNELLPANALIPFYLWHFISLVLFLLLMAGKLIKLPFLTLGWILGKFEKTAVILNRLKSSRNLQTFDSKRRAVIRNSLTLLTGTMAVGSVYEVYRKDRFDTTDIPLGIANLPPSFEGFSIGFISDIHSGVFMSAERMRSYAEAVNAMNADMIVVTGDFVNSDLEEVYPLSEAFRILHAPHGVFGVLGNHDYYTRRVDEVAGEINRSGIELLRNRSLPVRKGSGSIILSGVDDTGNNDTAGRYFREAYVKDAADVPQILLCHRPYFFRDAARVGYDLVLSGHTHGGQVVLGEMGKDVLAPARFVSPYVAGLYVRERSQMYVSRGIGTVGVPFRFNCPPEITKIILTKAPSA